MTVSILDEIDAVIRAHERSLALPVRMPCRCSWCRRQGMTGAMPAVPAPAIANDQIRDQPTRERTGRRLTGWWRARRQ